MFVCARRSNDSGGRFSSCFPTHRERSLETPRIPMPTGGYTTRRVFTSESFRPLPTPAYRPSTRITYAQNPNVIASISSISSPAHNTKNVIYGLVGRAHSYRIYIFRMHVCRGASTYQLFFLIRVQTNVRFFVFCCWRSDRSRSN